MTKSKSRGSAGIRAVNTPQQGRRLDPLLDLFPIFDHIHKSPKNPVRGHTRPICMNTGRLVRYLSFALVPGTHISLHTVNSRDQRRCHEAEPLTSRRSLCNSTSSSLSAYPYFRIFESHVSPGSPCIHEPYSVPQSSRIQSAHKNEWPCESQQGVIM